MLSVRHSSPPVILREPEAPSRSPGRILGARTLDELRELLSAVLQGLYDRQAWFELFVIADGEDFAPVVHRGAHQKGIRLFTSLRSRMLARRLLLTEAHVVGPLDAPPRGSAMTAPVLDGDGALVGVLVVEAAPRTPEFTRVDLVALEGIAALLSVALQRLGAKGHSRARARMELDRSDARRVQRGLMSNVLPPDAGVTAHAEYLPAFDVGGDFFTVKHVGDRTVVAAIGDVSGNGVSAALVMSRVAADIERALVAGERPSAVLNKVNGTLAGSDAERFVTAACLRLDVETRKLSVSNAGHLPLVVRRADGEVFACAGASGMPLGMFPGEYFEEELALEPRDIVLLMTDGLLEALDHPTGHRGLQLLLGDIRTAPHHAGVISERIRAVVERARSRHEVDDVTWVALQLEA